MRRKQYKIKTHDGFDLETVVFMPTKQNGKVIVMCHGLTGVKEGRVPEDTHLTELATKLCGNGFKVVQFDWRGHGQSSGKDLDVNCESFFNDLDAVIKHEKGDMELYLWGWSIGGFAIVQYLQKSKLKVERVVLWSPVFEPSASFFYNKNSLACYRSIVDSTKDGNLYKNKFALWTAKNFKISLDFLNQSREFDFLRAVACLPQKTLVILGDADVLVDKTYAETMVEEFGFDRTLLTAGHALIEDVEKAVDLSVEYFIK